MTYKCIIIGLGQIGMGYDLEHEKDKVYTHAKAFSESPDFDLIGGVDLSKTKRDLFSQKYKVNTYLDIESAIKVKRADLIIIASPTEKHYSILKQILNCSLPKAVLCEKPLAFDIHDAEEMVNLCKKYGVKLFVNYMRRSDPGVIEIKKRIKSRKILTPIKGVVWYSKGFIHNGSHFFNLLEFWLGTYIKSQVLSSGRSLDNSDSEPDVEVDFKNGKVIFISAWEEAFSHYTIELVSKSGRLRYDNGGELITWNSVHIDPDIPGYQILKNVPEIISNDMEHYQRNVANELKKAIEKKSSNISTGEESLNTLKAMKEIINQGEKWI